MACARPMRCRRAGKVTDAMHGRQRGEMIPCKAERSHRGDDMPIFLYRVVAVVNARLQGWRLPLLIVVVVFATSWFGMWLVEPVENNITRPEIYWWWFLVTAATVGYGDYYPTTPFGYIMGGYVIVGGIVTLTILFTRLG